MDGCHCKQPGTLFPTSKQQNGKVSDDSSCYQTGQLLTRGKGDLRADKMMSRMRPDKKGTIRTLQDWLSLLSSHWWDEHKHSRPMKEQLRHSCITLLASCSHWEQLRLAEAPVNTGPRPRPWCTIPLFSRPLLLWQKGICQTGISSTSFWEGHQSPPLTFSHHGVHA